MLMKILSPNFLNTKQFLPLKFIMDIIDAGSRTAGK